MTFSSPAPALPPAQRAASTSTGCSAARTGLAIEDFLGIAWFHAAPLISPHSPAELAAAGFHTVLAQLQLKYRDPGTAAAAARLLVADVPALRARFSRDTARLHRSSLRPFWETPYVRLDSGRILPVSSELALNRGIRGVYHLLIDQAGRLGGTRGERPDELHRPAARGVPHRPPGARARLRSPRHVRHRGRRDGGEPRPDKPPFDAAIIADGTLVLIEMLTATLRLATLESCDPALYRRDFDRDFKKKARQLVRAVEGVGNGTWTIPGVEPASVRRIVPVLASLHPFPLFGPMWTPFTAAFATPTFGHGAMVMPLQLVTDEDLEILEAFQASGSMSIVDALTRRASQRHD